MGDLLLCAVKKGTVLEDDEVHVAVARGEVLRRWRPASVHHRWVRLLQRFRLAPDVAGMKAVAIEVEFFVVGPGSFQKFEPFGGIFVAVVVRTHLRTEHVELVLKPTAHDIEREPPVRNVIDGRGHLRDHKWMHQRHVAGCKHGDGFGQCAECGGPGKTLERRAVEIRRSAVTAPAPDRQQCFHTRAVDCLRDFDGVGPIEFPGFRHHSDGRTMAAIECHNTEFHAVATEQPRTSRRVVLSG